MRCRNCGQDHFGVRYTRFCRNCGALLALFPASDEEQEDFSPGVAQKQIVSAPTDTGSPGPLLTGGVAFDAALGFLGEIVAFALVLYGIRHVFLLFATPDAYPFGFVEMFAIFATAAVLFRQTKAMRERYPTFARGWQTGRNTWGKGIDHLLTLTFGVLMLCVLFPLGGLLFCLGLSYGPVAWVVALAVAYLFGILARRMSGGSQKPGGNPP